MSKRDSRTFHYRLPVLRGNEFPNIPRSPGASLRIEVNDDGGVDIRGNSRGLLCLAQYVAAMGLHTSNTGLHVHLDSEEKSLDPGSRGLAIHNTDFLAKKKRASTTSRRSRGARR